ncbi:hypothetical protein TNCV_984231 [Trichonephila clavipes]|nr:hypothetical protein TNCV_984231 [Trichonephila clavipes]
MTKTITELAPPVLTTTPTGGRLNFCDRCNEHRSPTLWVFIGTSLELMITRPRVGCLDQQATAVASKTEKEVLNLTTHMLL